VNNAETVLDTSDALLLSARTITDIRQAGRALAFDVPTAAGFHSVRAVESVARGYHTVLLGNAPKDGEPLGPLLNTLRDKRDALTASKAINKDDLLHIIIETLARINNVFRKPLTHPDMVLDLSGAMTVFDSSKCAIELMLSDARKKCATPITNGFF
jgi:hypothetical protein